MKLYDSALVCRSKNAGPFQVTIDLMFNTVEEFDRVLASPNFTVEKIAAMYGADPGKIAIKSFKRILTIKVVLPRISPSGSASDTDVYGSQQHFPLGNLEI